MLSAVGCTTLSSTTSAAPVSDRRTQDGSILLRLDECNDLPLRRWILSFGASAGAVAPASLAFEIAESHDRALQWYRPRRTYRTAKIEEAHINEMSA